MGKDETKEKAVTKNADTKKVVEKVVTNKADAYEVNVAEESRVKTSSIQAAKIVSKYVFVEKSIVVDEPCVVGKTPVVNPKFKTTEYRPLPVHRIEYSKKSGKASFPYAADQELLPTKPVILDVKEVCLSSLTIKDGFTVVKIKKRESKTPNKIVIAQVKSAPTVNAHKKSMYKKKQTAYVIPEAKSPKPVVVPCEVVRAHPKDVSVCPLFSNHQRL